MPELPEVEAWVRELDPLVSRSPVARAGPSHIATREDVRPSDRDARGADVRRPRRRGKNLLFPTEDGELILRVHLMSAGRLRYHPPGAKTPKTPMFRLASTTAASWSSPRRARSAAPASGSSRRTGSTPSSRTSGPRRSASAPSGSGEILDRERRQLHPLLRDQRALAGIGRAHANEILWLAKLSPFKLSTDLSTEETERLAAAIDEDLERALVLREAGKGDAASTASTATSASRARSGTTRSAASRSRSTRSRTARPARPAARS